MKIADIKQAAEQGFMLAEDVAIEPLVDGWPAWLMLLDPVAAGFYRRRHIELMVSYLANPERHAKALRDARLSGGFFCDLEPVSSAVVRSYLEWYEESSREHLRFAAGLEQVRRDLMESDPAGRLPAYAGIPASLRGRIEMRYDYLGRQSLRLLRGADTPPEVNGCAIWAKASARPALLSTPRVQGDPRAEITDANPDALGMLSSLHHCPASMVQLEQCASAAGVTDPRRLVVRGSRTAVTDPRIRFIGHASVAIPMSGGLLVTDPVPPSSNPAARHLTNVRLVLISHGHPDHFNAEALVSLLHMQPTVVVPSSGSLTPFDPALKSAAYALGFKNVVELRPYECIAQDDLTVTALPFLGEHGSLAIDAKAVFQVDGPQISMLLAADVTGLDPHVLETRSRAAKNVCLVIGIEPAGARAGWLYGPVLGKSPAGLRLAKEPLAGADALDVMELARVSGAKTIRIYGTGAPGMGHILGRSSLNESRAAAEVRKLRELPGAEDLDIRILAKPGEEVLDGCGP